MKKYLLYGILTIGLIGFTLNGTNGLNTFIWAHHPIGKPPAPKPPPPPERPKPPEPEKPKPPVPEKPKPPGPEQPKPPVPEQPKPPEIPTEPPSEPDNTILKRDGPAWSPALLPSVGVDYYFLYNNIPPRQAKKVVTDTSGSKVITLLDIIGEFPTSYLIPYDLELLEAWNGLSGVVPAVKQSESFKPFLNSYLRQLLILTFVQMMSYLSESPESQAAGYLVELGQPSLVATQITLKTPSKALFKDLPAAQRIATYIQKAVGEPAPQPPPEVLKGKNYFETMCNSLIIEELGSDYYYPGNNEFASRLETLGEAVLPDIIESAKNSPHSLIKRNAVSLLGHYDTPAVLETLRAVLKGADKVARNRALIILINKGDREIVPFLIDTLKDSDDIYFKTFAAYALGMLGDKQSVKPLLDYLNTGPNNNDIIWGVVPSLGLIGDNSKEIIDLLKKIAGKKRGVAKTFTLLSLYALGDEESAIRLNLNPGGHPLNKIEFPAQYFALRVLKMKGEKDIPILWSIVNDEMNDPRFRLSALFNIKFTKKHVNDLKGLIDNYKTPAILKAYALYVLSSLISEKELTQYATDVIVKGLPALKKKELKSQGEGFDITLALRILGALNSNKESVLKDVISTMAEIIKNKNYQEREKIFPIARAPVMEAAILELGAIGSKEARNELVNLLQLSDFPCRAEVAKALGQCGAEKTVIEGLIKTLGDDDGWVRYCAYSSLNKLSGNNKPLEGECEWFFGSAEERTKAVKSWQKWWEMEKTNKK